MKPVSHALLSSEAQTALAARIASLETGTDAELVCAVAGESGRYDRAESICGLLGALLAFLTLGKLESLDAWQGGASFSLGAQTIALVAGFVGGTVLASHWHGLRRLFTSSAEMAAETHRAAHLVFSRHGIGATRHGGGLLIYLSLFERRLEILPDRALRAHLGPEACAAIRDAILSRLDRDSLLVALQAGLEKAAPLLAAASPASTPAGDSLPDQVLIFSPRP
jgi:putative membrane protein